MQVEEPRSKRQRRTSFTQIDLAQIYATESQLLQHEENDEISKNPANLTNTNQTPATQINRATESGSLLNLFAAETSKASTSREEDEPENLVDLF
jgi:hypothetical protein